MVLVSLRGRIGRDEGYKRLESSTVGNGGNGMVSENLGHLVG